MSSADMVAATAIAAGWLLAGLVSLRAGTVGRVMLLVGALVAGARGRGARRRRRRRGGARRRASTGLVATLVASLPDARLGSAGGPRASARSRSSVGALVGAAHRVGPARPARAVRRGRRRHRPRDRRPTVADGRRSPAPAGPVDVPRDGDRRRRRDRRRRARAARRLARPPRRGLGWASLARSRLSIAVSSRPAPRSGSTARSRRPSWSAGSRCS